MSDNAAPAEESQGWVPYHYTPSRVAAIIFIVLFALTTFLHTFQVVKKRTWYFIPLVIGGFFEILGYVGRLISVNDVMARGPFIMQAVLLLVAPALVAASIYIILGRIILLVDGEKYSLIRQKWLTKIFVAGDVLSFVVQSAGGGVQGSDSESARKLGERLVLAGLFLQIVFFGIFMVVAGHFHWKLVRHASSRVHDLPWKKHMYALYAASVLIMVRSIFRVIEYIQGTDGYLLKREVFLYVFDATLMLIVVAVFNWVHPSEVTDIYNRRKRESDIELREG